MAKCSSFFKNGIGLLLSSNGGDHQRAFMLNRCTATGRERAEVADARLGDLVDDEVRPIVEDVSPERGSKGEMTSTSVPTSTGNTSPLSSALTFFMQLALCLPWRPRSLSCMTRMADSNVIESTPVPFFMALASVLGKNSSFFSWKFLINSLTSRLLSFSRYASCSLICSGTKPDSFGSGGEFLNLMSSFVAYSLRYLANTRKESSMGCISLC
mmetsp:Transcript_66946/g.200020  ORF Transcript_66946/g.200020 Transcript_66946/m.200020 type:complete len:213 (-) Transcript_66946:619-1257(-)